MIMVIIKTIPYCVCLLFIVKFLRVESNIGVNYGTLANNLPPPNQVAKFLRDSTIINRVRLFDANPEMVRAFAHTGIAITVTVPNAQIPWLTNLTFAQDWVKTNISPYIHTTNIIRVLVGNEVLATANRVLIANLVPAMQALHVALVGESWERRIQVSTPHSLGIFALFDENLKPGPTFEQHFGLFSPELAPVYDIGILKPNVALIVVPNYILLCPE